MLVIFSGPSGVGKSFLTDKLAKVLGFHRLRIVTTRPLRENETTTDKECVSTQELEELRATGEIFYEFEFLGNIYAYRKSEILDHQNVVVEIPQEAISGLKKLYSDVKTIYLLPKNIADIEEKIRQREADPAIIEKRVTEIHKVIQELKADNQLRDQFDFVVETEYNQATTGAVLQIACELLEHKEKTFFTLREDFNAIIAKSLPDKIILNIHQISTGWTNIVFEAETPDGNYFFRFPRDDFWARTIVKDAEFANFIYNKTSSKTVKPELLLSEQRPYTMHEKIAGNTLAERIDHLSPEKIEEVGKRIAQFMHELHTIDFSGVQVLSAKNIGFRLTDFLDELLELHVSDEDRQFWNLQEFSKKNHDCLVHGDFNLSNVLLDENDNLAAVIDFGFGGFGNKYFDIARILNRDCPKTFRDSIVRHYGSFSGKRLDEKILNEEISIWSKIDSGYINYMRGIGIYE